MEVNDRENAFNGLDAINTDEVERVLLEALQDHVIDEDGADLFINAYREIAPEIPVDEEFVPVPAIQAAENNEPTAKEEVVQGYMSAVQRLERMILEGAIKPKDAKKLLMNFSGKVDGSKGKGQSKGPELPQIPKTSAIVIVRGRGRRRIKMAVEVRPDNEGGINFSKIQDPSKRPRLK